MITTGDRKCPRARHSEDQGLLPKDEEEEEEERGRGGGGEALGKRLRPCSQ